MKKQDEQVYYNPMEEPVVIPKATTDAFLKQSNPGDLMALYQFYYYTAKWQKTNQPHATGKYCMKALKWGRQKYMNARNKLIELGLIEKVKRRDKEGRIIGNYIKVNFIWSKEKENPIQMYQNQQVDPIQMYQNRQVDEAACGNSTTNALSSNRRNALISNSDNIDNTNVLSYSPAENLKLTSDARDTFISFRQGKGFNALVKNKKEMPVKKEKQRSVKTESSPPVHESTNEIIEYWNRLPKTANHKINPDSATYQSIVYYVSNLLEGKPIWHRKDGTPAQPVLNFISRFGLEESLLYQKYTVREIKYILRRLHDQDFKNPASSRDKYKLPTVFWNNFAGRQKAFSWFLYKASRIDIDEKYKDMARKLANIVNPQLEEKKLLDWAKTFQQFTSRANGNREEMERQVNLILDWYKDNFDNTYVKKTWDAENFVKYFSQIVSNKKQQENKSKETSDRQKPSNWLRDKPEDRMTYSW